MLTIPAVAGIVRQMRYWKRRANDFLEQITIGRLKEKTKTFHRGGRFLRFSRIFESD
jgi:hypothetical protein